MHDRRVKETKIKLRKKEGDVVHKRRRKFIIK